MSGFCCVVLRSMASMPSANAIVHSMSVNTLKPMKWCAAILAVVLAPGAAFAQDTASAWPWPDMEKAGLPTVYVRDDAGTESSGKLLRFDPDAIVLLVDDVERRVEAARVRRIEKRGDSLRNGAIAGAVVGAAIGLIGMGLADCPGSDPGGSCPGARAALVLLSSGIYAAVGTGIDALVVGRTTLYEAPATMRPSTPLPNGRRIAVGLSVRW